METPISSNKYCNDLLHLQLESMVTCQPPGLKQDPQSFGCHPLAPPYKSVQKKIRNTSCPSTPFAMRPRFHGCKFSGFGFLFFEHNLQWLKLIINFLSAMSFRGKCISEQSLMTLPFANIPPTLVGFNLCCWTQTCLLNTESKE